MRSFEGGKIVLVLSCNSGEVRGLFCKMASARDISSTPRGGVNRPVTIQLKLKSNSLAALPLFELGTTAPVGEISSQFKIYSTKFRSGKFLSFLQGGRS